MLVVHRLSHYSNEEYYWRMVNFAHDANSVEVVFVLVMNVGFDCYYRREYLQVPNLSSTQEKQLLQELLLEFLQDQLQERGNVLSLSHQRAFLRHQSLPQLYFFYFRRQAQRGQSSYLSMYGLPQLPVFVAFHHHRLAHSSHRLDQHKRNRSLAEC